MTSHRAPAPPHEPPGAATGPTGPAGAAVETLAVEGVTKRYGGVSALTDVSLHVVAGEVHAVLGENGAGKSTLMNVITGAVQPDEGSVSVGGGAPGALSPALAAASGIAIVRQHPAVLPDMTVLENLQVALPASALPRGRGAREAAQRILSEVSLDVELRDRVEGLTVAQRHLLEIAKALAVEPKLLILDEPTAPLGAEATEMLFARVRTQVAAGTSVIYITHRMAEVRQLADRVTVLRDGRVRGTARVDEITDEALLALILGRELESAFPPKHPGGGDTTLELTDLSGPGFTGVSVTAGRGEVVGLAGVVGNGQSAVLRGLAGLEPVEGGVAVGGRSLGPRELLREAAYMPADRHSEGLMMSLSVRENAAVSALRSFRRGPLVSTAVERERVVGSLGSLSVRAPSLDAPVSALSGGNQQKVVISRALLAEPALLLADEPTQGVDVGARAEIYGILREASERGVPVVVASSDAKELEGLCDVVLVMSRGQVVATLRGEEITEERIVGAAVSARTAAAAVPQELRQDRARGFRRFLKGDYAPSALVAVVIVLLTALLLSRNPEYLSPFNVANVLTAATALGLIALGQNIALLTGGIDLSVGPLAGFLVVVASFYVNDDSPTSRVVLGLLLMLAVAAASGALSGFLIRIAGFTPIAATLVLYIGLGGFALLLRPTADGYISQSFQSAINTTVGPLPVVFIAFVVIAVVMELLLRRTRWGWRLRAVGSHEESARGLGIRVDRTVVLAYVTASCFVFLGALVLMGQYGVGDPAQGSSFTLSSITAVVLGGTSLLGGRGSFIGPLLGAVLLQQALGATVFLDLGTVYQYVFQGVLILAAAVLYTAGTVRRRRRVADAT